MSGSPEFYNDLSFSSLAMRNAKITAYLCHFSCVKCISGSD